MKRFLIFLIIIVFVQPVLSKSINTQKMLESFVEDFRKDPAAKERQFTFGIKIKEKGSWKVVIDENGVVELKSNMPDKPAPYYIIDYETLKLIYEKKMSALTAMGKAKMSDPAPMDFDFMEGFEPDSNMMGWLAEFTFHFWTRGVPEIVNFGEQTKSRFVHGGFAKILYYQEGLRSAWYQLKRGQHINKSPEDQINPFPTLIIMIKGETEAKIGGKHIILKKNNCLHIPAKVAHEFWNKKQEPAEFIIIMFGKGA